jgi:nucleoside-diphosphate-sugar epimerase
MSRIFITGTSGFIGSHVLRKLLEGGMEIIAPSRHSRNTDDLDRYSNLHILPGLFYDYKILQRIKEYKPDVMIHLAASRGEGRGSWEDYYKVNVVATDMLLDFVLNSHVNLFVYYSTVGVYGTIPRTLPASINSSLQPDNFYHRSKYEAEQLIIKKLKGKIPFVILRPTITYGPGDNGFLVKLIDLVRKKRFPLIRKDIKIHLLNVHILRELVSTLIQHDFTDHEIINIADTEPIQFNELVDMIYSHFHGDNYPDYLKLPAWTFSAGKLMCDVLNHKKLKTSLQLVSQSWYYNVTPLWDKYPLKRYDTLTSINQLLQHEYPRN